MYQSVRSVSGSLRRASSSCSSREFRRSIVTDTEVDQARNYCVKQLRHGDYEAYLIRQFIPRSAQDAYDALRTLNLELARLPETVSSPTIGRFRIQFWRDTINNVFAGKPPREPISILLYKAVTDLKARAGSCSSNSLKFWLLRFVTTRERHMENRPFTSLSSLEDYAENTYATLMYMTLAAMPLQSVHMDHLASHIGKACGIVATLRGIPVLAAPSQPIQGPSGANLGTTRSPALLLPLDVMAEVGLKEEDVFRMGPNAEGLQDAVFQVATRANDHLITAREMIKTLRAGEGPGHDYEHEGEVEHAYPAAARTPEAAEGDIRRGFGVLLEAVAAEDYLKRLEGANFDPFRVKASWKLPWGLWRALKGHQI
ncbi:NADH dehydrogenase complex I, assembly factor 6 [Podospora australis]|uniref:NADH dehydrogenase complex I, assembly factor 6 n=1 Tax=Podospora australis TaxID=1536484 RepID=A0AAN6WTL9_9PEZI|nr:NADH dehydrogenase complex I, assembly factor 6 [Podospora australis]